MLERRIDGRAEIRLVITGRILALLSAVLIAGVIPGLVSQAGAGVGRGSVDISDLPQRVVYS